MKKNKSILITGGCGFVGTNLAIYLQKELKKFSIYTVDILKKDYSKFNANIRAGCFFDHRQCDILFSSAVC